MSYTYDDLLKAAHSLQINGDFVTVTYPFSNIQMLQVVTSQGLEVYISLEHDWVDGITTVLWACGDARSDGVVVESPQQVIMDLSAQVHQLHKSYSKGI